MRKSYFFIFVLVGISLINGQPNWTTLNPYPTANDLYSGSVLGVNKFIALSNYGQCFLSTDGGVNWDITIFDTTESIFRNLYFIDDMNGWAAGALGGGFYRTSNGGGSWTPITNAPDTTKYGIHFATPLIGWSVGFNGFIIKTTDGGVSWFSQSNTSISNKTLYGVYAVDQNTVFVVGNTGTVLKSTDGGATFAQVNLGSITSADYRAVRFTDANTGYVVGAKHRIIRTTDGGTTWTQLYEVSSTSRILWDIDFNSAGVGVAVGTDTVAFRSTDGGATWSSFILPGGSGPGVKYAVDFYGDNTVFSNGGRGYLAKSTDAGATWQEMGYRFSNNTINDIAFADAMNGYVFGNSGFMGRTTDGGTTWSLMSVTNGRKVNEISVPDVNTIYGACDSSRIVMSKDAGATWTEFNAGLGTTNQFIAIDFINTQYGMATGSNGNIMKTIDGGVNWTLVNLPTTTLAWDIDIVDTSYAYICGTGETIFRTTDGGTTWVQQFGAGGLGSYGISFVDRNVGFASGTSGNTYYTTNSGDTWTPSTILPDNTVWSTAMVKGPNGTVAFAACASGYVYTSNDGGVTWKEEPRQTINTFNDMFALDAGTAWFAGNSGTMVKFTDPSAVPVELISFKGVVEGNSVILNFTVANAINNAGFAVQRTKAGVEKWEEVSFIRGEGVCALCNYEYIDKDLLPGSYRYRLLQRDYDGTITTYPLLQTMAVGIITDYALYQNYPNPFNPSTVIRFALPVAGQVNLSVYNSLGEQVAVLINETMEAGAHEINFEPKQMSSGTYFYKLVSGNYTMTRKLVLMR